ncbi:MAG: hypothetical protein NTV80_19925 [Verrucomicrobia bacterium]|nr:hypothetical protein [Verrucomicrobiota bacterium]
MLIYWMLVTHKEALNESLDLPTDVDTSSLSPLRKAVLSANRHYSADIQNARWLLRKRMAKLILLVDRIEVLSLGSDELGKSEIGRKFEIEPYKLSLPVINAIEVGPNDLQAIKLAFAEILKEQDLSRGGAWDHRSNAALCFYIDGIEFYKTSVSWETNNYFMAYPDDGPGESSWVGIESSQELRKIISSLNKNK